MRFGVLTSGALHAGLILYLVVGLPSAFNQGDIPSVLPVELLTIDEFTNIQSRQESEPESEPEEEPIVEQQEERKFAAIEPPTTTPAPESEAEEVEYVPGEEPEPEPQPKPKVIEAKPPPLPNVRPRAKPKPPDKKFSLSEIAALLDKSQEAPQERRQPQEIPGAPPPLLEQAPTTGAGLQTGLTMSEIDAFKVQMRRCWNVPLGAANADELIVTMQVFLKPDGYLIQRPELVPDGRFGGDRNAAYIAAAESASRAIIQCQPFQMPPDKYSSWGELLLTFDPSQMMGR